MNSKYHTRDHYEIVLIELMKLAGTRPADVRSYSNNGLLIDINNHLAYFNLETFNLDEIEAIAKALNKKELV